MKKRDSDGSRQNTNLDTSYSASDLLKLTEECLPDSEDSLVWDGFCVIPYEDTVIPVPAQVIPFPSGVGVGVAGVLVPSGGAILYPFSPAPEQLEGIVAYRPMGAPVGRAGVVESASQQLPVPSRLIKTNCGNDVNPPTDYGCEVSFASREDGVYGNKTGPAFEIHEGTQKETEKAVSVLRSNDEDIKEYNFTIARFENYIKKREDWYVKIHGKVKLTGTDFTYKKTDVHRWKDGYLKKRLARLYKLREWFEMQPSQVVTMITLTVPHNVNKWGKLVRTGHNAYQAWENLKRGWDRIRTSRNGIFRGKDYVFFYEPHPASGYPHGHIMLFGEPLTYDERKHLHEVWSELTGADLEAGVEVTAGDQGRPIDHLIAYLMKYMSKTLYHTMDEWSPGEWLFNAIAHEKGYRLFTSSNNLSKIMKLTGEKDGTVECLDVSLEGLKPRISDDEVNSVRIWSNPDLRVNSPFLRQVDAVPISNRISAWMTRTGETFRPEERVFAARQKKWREWERRRATA